MVQDIHIGPLPPDLNGISVYLYRLSKIDKKSQFIDWNKISSPKKFRSWLIKQILDFNKKNFIFHPPSIKKRLIFYFLSLVSIHYFSLVIHGYPLIIQYQEANLFQRVLIRRMLEKARFIQVVNKSHKRFLDYLKIKNKNVFIKPAFLPPPLEDREKIIKSYNQELIHFINTKKPLIAANAACVKFYNGIDLYGLDHCIELTARLIHDFPNLGFIFAISNDKLYPSYLKKMKYRIKSLNIEKNFYFISGQKELWPLFEKINLFIRPTHTDGDAISVREALYFNCSVACSDVTSRPQGTILFKNRDLEDMYQTIKKILYEKGFH
ncbi:MAG: glycosyltransferase [Candidatus Helarchaeota archaeon]